MMLPVAVLLSEWHENQIQPEVLSINNLKKNQCLPSPETPSNPRRIKASQARPNATNRKRPNIAISEHAQKILPQRQNDYDYEVILSKVNSLMRPKLKFQKLVPQDFQTVNNSDKSVLNQNLYGKPPPPLKYQPSYPSNSDNETDPHQSLDSVRNRLDYHAPTTIHKPNRRKVVHLRSKFHKVTKFPSESNTLAEYFHYKKVSKRLPPLPEAHQPSASTHSLPQHQDIVQSSMVCEISSEKETQGIEITRPLPQDKQITISANLCVNKSNREGEDHILPMQVYEESPMQVSLPRYIQEDVDAASYLQLPPEYFTKISFLIRDANTKLNRIIKGLALDMTAPFEYFDDGVFVEEKVVHKILYASGLMFRDQKSNEEDSKPEELPNDSVRKPPLLTCNQLEKALSSKLSVHATPFTFNRQKSTEQIRSRPKISMESFMEFLSCMSEIKIKSLAPSDSLSYANFVDPLLTPLIRKREDDIVSVESVTKLPVQRYDDDLQGQQLTEEEEKNGCAAGLVPIGSELRRSTDSIANPQPDVKVMYGGRDILEMGINVRDQWKDINRWQVGPNVKGPEDDRQDRDREWKRSRVKRCENCSFHYHEH